MSYGNTLMLFQVNTLLQHCTLGRGGVRRECCAGKWSSAPRKSHSNRTGRRREGLLQNASASLEAQGQIV